MEDEETRVIDYKVEELEIGEKGVIRNITISLLCPDPFFRDLEDLSVCAVITMISRHSSLFRWTGFTLFQITS